MVAQLIVTGAKKALKQIKDDEKQSRFAASKALNVIARPAINDQKQLMKRVFDRPTPFILNAFRVSQSAKRDNLQLKIAVKDIFARGGTDPLNDTLRPNIEGKRRRQKKHEVALRRAGVINSNEYIVPTRNARLNRFGNISKATLGKIVSDLSRGSTKTRRQYVLGEVGSTKGIFRVRGGFDRVATGRWDLIFLVVKKAPTYRSRYDFVGQAEKSFVKRFEPQFDIELARAFATRR